jgi:hypothetical protein
MSEPENPVSGNEQTNGAVGDGKITQVVKAERGSTISHVTQVIADKYYSRSQAEELSHYLERAVAAFEARMYQLVARPPAPPDQPYKFLYAFEIEDADIFFGRDTASEALQQTVLKDRLAVLHAKSGAGKTSLLNAGLSPRLIRQGRLPVYARAYEDPALAVKRTVAPPSLGPWPELLPQLTLHEFLGLACAHLSHQTQELVVVLDQFEEFFIFWPERAHRQPFIDALADCYDDKTLPMRLVIALRKDYYSDLATFQDRLLHIFHNEYFLGAMNRDEAQAAVTDPVARLPHPVAYERTLLERLLDDLSRGEIELPHLQILCTRLYEALGEGETTITLDSYEKLGRVEGVLGGYLNDVLSRLPGGGAEIAKDVLKELVSSEATKRVLSGDRLAVRVEAEGDELETVLARLVDARLLHRDQVAGEVTYEMAHEVLIQEIQTWIDQADLAFKQAEELLVREVANWRANGTLIPGDRMELLYPHQKQFAGLDGEMLECLLRSALEGDCAVEDWAELAGDVSEKPALAALNDPREYVRRAAMRSLGTVWGLPEVVSLGEEDPRIRRGATWALEELGDPRAAEPLVAALRDSDWDVRRMAVEALVKMAGRCTVGPLLTALRNEDWDVRRKAAIVLGATGYSQAVGPLIAVLRGETDAVEVIAEATWALGKLGDLRAVDSIMVVWEEWGSNAKCRQAAIWALGRLGDPRSMPLLLAALQDTDNDVRWVAAEGLGQLGDPDAVEPLITALRDDDGAVRKAAAEALKEIGTPEALTALKEWERS